MANGQQPRNVAPDQGIFKRRLNDAARLVPVEAITLYTGATAFIWQNERDLDRLEKTLYLGLVVLVCVAVICLVLWGLHHAKRKSAYVVAIIAFVLWAVNVNQVQVFGLFDIDSKLSAGLAALALMTFTIVAPYFPNVMED